MVTKINLSAGQQYHARFATRAVAESGLLRFAWIYVTGKKGSASLRVTDTDGIAQPSAEVPVPGMFAGVLRQSSVPNLTEVVLTAGSDGFRGELEIDVFGH